MTVNSEDLSSKRTLKDVVIKQLYAEFSALADTLLRYMDSQPATSLNDSSTSVDSEALPETITNPISALRICMVHDVLLDIKSTIPGNHLLDAEYPDTGKMVYLMFRQCLVNRRLDIDPVGSTGDATRDEHLLFRLAKYPSVKTLEEIAVTNGYSFKTEEYFYNEQGPALYSLMDELSGTADRRRAEVVSAIKGRSASVAMSVPPELNTDSSAESAG